MAQNTFGKLETMASAPPPSAAQLRRQIGESAKRVNNLKEEANVSASTYDKDQVAGLAERAAQEHEAIEGLSRSVEASRQLGTITENEAVHFNVQLAQINSGMAYAGEQINRLAIVHLPVGERLMQAVQGAGGAIGAIARGGGAARGAVTASRSLQSAAQMRHVARRMRPTPPTAAAPKPTAATSTSPQAPRTPAPTPVTPSPTPSSPPPSAPATGGAHIRQNRMKRHEVGCFQAGDATKKKTTEYDKQLANQEKGLNEMTVQEYMDGRARFNQMGREGTGAAQQAARERYHAELSRGFERTLERQGVGGAEAARRAANLAGQRMGSLAALHNPDMIAGGRDAISRLGDRGVNSSIGSQWNRGDRIQSLDRAAAQVPEHERANTRMNAKLKRCK